MKYVYVIGPEVNSLNAYKIGKANCVKNRMAGLQTGNSLKLKIYYSFACSKPYLLETFLHERYDKHRGIGEWFTLEKNVVDTIEKTRQILFVKKI